MITKNDDDDERWYQYAVLHGGEDCKSSKYPAIFNLVEDVENVHWINKVAFNEACDNRGAQNQTNGKCVCKQFVSGERCNECVSGKWNLTQSNPDGCQCK